MQKSRSTKKFVFVFDGNVCFTSSCGFYTDKLRVKIIPFYTFWKPYPLVCDNIPISSICQISNHSDDPPEIKIIPLCSTTCIIALCLVSLPTKNHWSVLKFWIWKFSPNGERWQKMNGHWWWTVHVNCGTDHYHRSLSCHWTETLSSEIQLFSFIKSMNILQMKRVYSTKYINS